MNKMRAMQKFIDALIHCGPDLYELRVVAKYLSKLDKETIVSIFEYGEYFKFMKFRSKFLEGVASKDLDKVAEAIDIFDKYLLPTVKEKNLYRPSHIDYFTERRKQLGLVKT